MDDGQDLGPVGASVTYSFAGLTAEQIVSKRGHLKVDYPKRMLTGIATDDCHTPGEDSRLGWTWVLAMCFIWLTVCMFRWALLFLGVEWPRLARASWPRTRSTPCSPMTGRATCASCVTSCTARMS